MTLNEITKEVHINKKEVRHKDVRYLSVKVKMQRSSQCRNSVVANEVEQLLFFGEGVIDVIYIQGM